VALSPVEGQIGAAFTIGGGPACVERFDAPAALRKLLPKDCEKLRTGRGLRAAR
jgi:hypothetical protein